MHLKEYEKKLKNGVYLDYCQWVDKASQTYEKYAVLYQLGEFYEIYGYDMENFKYGNIFELQKVLNCNVTHKNGKKPHSYSNPKMMGFNINYSEKFINILKRNNYVIYLINQKDNPNPTIKEKTRELTKIISPGTDSTPDNIDNSFLLSIYMDEYNGLKTIGTSYIDISTGKSYASYFEDTRHDNDIAFNELLRIIASINPKEILIYNKNIMLTEKEIIQQLNINNNIMVRYFTNNLDKELFNVIFQQHYFDKVFKTKKGGLNVIDYLGFEHRMQTQHSFILLLHIIDTYYSKLLENLEKPELEYNGNKLMLDTTTILQLNILDNNQNSISDYRTNKNNSVFNVINYTKTNIGYRLLKHRITNPEIDIDIINNRYNMANELIDNDNYRFFDNILFVLPDFERLHRKLFLNTLKPKEFYTLDQGYKTFKKIYEQKFPLLKKYLNDKMKINELNKYITIYNKLFNVSYMNIDSYLSDKNIFSKGKYPDLDTLFENRKGCIDNYKVVQSKFKEFFRSVLKTYKEREDYVKIKTTKTLKYLKITEAKYKILKKHKDKLSNYKVIIGSKTIKLSDLKIVQKNSEYRIIDSSLDYKNIEEIDAEIYKLTKKYFHQTIKNYSLKYEKLYKHIVDIVGEVDFTYSNAKCSIKNNYVKPELIDSDESFFEFKNMRHPMVEKITNDVYKPFDLKLDNEKIGLVLSGLNGTGKSICLKTAGIMITLAQMGYYVPATRMRYSIFRKIMTRILGNDNILTNSSSFQVEMSELRSITTRADKHTLVLVDELCRGTEHNSSVALTVATIQEFTEFLKNRFIITTHLHKIFDYISDINNILIKHISIKYEDGKLKYERELKDGPSPTNYGLLVAEAQKIPLRLISRAENIRKDLLNKQSSIFVTKKSKYNSKKIVDCCEICGSSKNLHTDHINPQKNADSKGFFSDGTHKNHIGNLQILCEKCHKSKTKDDLNKN